MASASASDIVTVEYQRSYIKIETSRGKNPTEIHSALCEVCGEQTVDRNTVCGQTVDRGTLPFGLLVFVNDDQRLGRPKTSTYERRVKLVADFLHKIVERRARKYHKLPGFHQHQYSVF